MKEQANEPTHKIYYSFRIVAHKKLSRPEYWNFWLETERVEWLASIGGVVFAKPAGKDEVDGCLKITSHDRQSPPGQALINDAHLAHGGQAGVDATRGRGGSSLGGSGSTGGSWWLPGLVLGSCGKERWSGREGSSELIWSDKSTSEGLRAWPGEVGRRGWRARPGPRVLAEPGTGLPLAE